MTRETWHYILATAAVLALLLVNPGLAWAQQELRGPDEVGATLHTLVAGEHVELANDSSDFSAKQQVGQETGLKYLDALLCKVRLVGVLV